MKMEMPDVIYSCPNLDKTGLLAMKKHHPIKSCFPTEKYHHDRIVVALKAENESLKSKNESLKRENDNLLNGIRILGLNLSRANKAHDRAEANLEKAKWQPIETAPRRIPFLATGKTETPCVVTTTSKDMKDADYPFCCYHTQICFRNGKFTHWMPLPDAPEQH